MRGREILDNADVLITDNRIVAVGRRQRDRTGRATVIDSERQDGDPGSLTPLPRPVAGARDPYAQVGQYPEQPGLRGDHHARSADEQDGRASYQDRVETGAMIGPRTTHRAGSVPGRRDP